MDFLERIIKEKQLEVDNMPAELAGSVRRTRSFIRRLKDNPQQLQIIGELKRASPSLGAINLDVDILAQAKAYEIAGVSAISVLTDPVFFKGKIDDLRLVAENVDLPVLNKDFIIDVKQIDRAVNAGATMILLIVAALSQDKLQLLYDYATRIGLEVLVEVHDKDELEIAHQLGAPLIGINNRDLKSFEVDIATSVTLAAAQEENRFYLSESGIKSAVDAKRVAPFYRGVLVGEALMKHQNPQQAVKALQVARHVD
jgi:indole-3-glycerol phosphate synthase